MSINKHISTVIWVTVALSIIIIVGCIVILGIGGEDKPVSEGISMFGDYFGGITTLAAAYIAAQLFNDWRLQHNHNSLKDVATNIYILYISLNVKLVAINDAFAKSLKSNKISLTEYNTTKIADDVESKVAEIGDLMTALYHQISFLQKLNGDKEQVLEYMYDVLYEYITIMDITYYRNLADHKTFASAESELKVRLSTLQDDFENYLKKFMVLDSK